MNAKSGKTALQPAVYQGVNVSGPRGQPSLPEMMNWLKNVLEAERRSEVLNEVRQELKSYYNHLGRVKEVKQPTIQVTRYSEAVDNVAFRAFAPVAITTMIILCITQPIWKFGETRYVEWLFYWDLSFGLIDRVVVFVFYIFASLAVSVAVSICIALLIGLPIYRHRKRKVDEENNSAISNWRITEALRQSEINRQLSKKPGIAKEFNELGRILSSVNAKKSELYSTNYLSKDYRGFVPVGVMYGYLTSGVCTTIYGHGGIIDTYRRDQQFALLNKKLDIIIDQLDEIRETHMELYHAIEKNQSETRRLRNDIAQYASEQHNDAAQMTECIRYGNDCLTWIKGVALYGSPYR